MTPLICTEALNGGGGGCGLDPVSVYIDQSGVVGICFNRRSERHSWLSYRESKVLIEVLIVL